MFKKKKKKKKKSYEPDTPIDVDYLNDITPTEILQFLHNFNRLNCKTMPLPEKYYHMARQFFVRRVCKFSFPTTND